MSEMEKHPPKGEDSNLIVALRVRPMSEDEIIQGATPIAHKVDKNSTYKQFGMTSQTSRNGRRNQMVVLMDPADDSDDILRANRSREKHYVFDCSFDGSTTQEEVYEHTSKFLIPQVIAGYNGTVFAYGATGAGKTYTMLGTDDDPGIMARALNDLFLKMEESSGEMTYEVSMSYLEIYNELIRDLLNPSVGFLDLREDSKGIQVAGLSEVHARSTREVMDMLMKGNKQRTQEPTAANKTSSRSHAVLQVSVKQRARMRNVMQQVRCGRLFLIDLAGSERAANTHNKGKRMVEGAHINRSLLALGNCINALSDKNGAKYVNYRDSKLTRLLKDALGGNCKTVMIAHISPASIHFEESRNTLVYADRAKQIKTKVRKNVMDVSYHITQYTNIIAELREEVKRLTTRLDHQQGKKNAAAIHAIQSEVMEAAMTEDQTEAMKLKEQLLTVFNEQMELRRSVMDLNNTSMEISLELARNQLFVQKWEREKALGSIRKRSFGVDPRLEDDDENKDKDTEKERELSGSPLVEEPEEVRLAREEMDTLHQERDKTERVKVNVMKELENSRDRAARIEEELPRKITSAEQQEILSLLCKVHELEIENMEMQSSCLLRNFELRRKDMLLSKHRQHHSLCHEIIMQQRHLIDTHDLAVPKELEELYTLYLQEVEERPATPQEAEDVLPSINNNRVAASVTTLNRRFLESDSLSDMDRLSQIDADSGSILGSRILVPVVSSAASNHVKKHLLKRSSQNLSKLEENELFSRSAKASQMPAAPVTSAAARQVHQRQPSILTLSSRSAATTPTPPVNKNEGEKPAASLRESNDDHTVIVSNTRSIAALAARRRTEASQDIALQLMPKNGSYLTASRLANHDRKYSNNTNLTLQHLMDTDNVSITTMDSNRMGQGPPRYRPTKKSQAAANKSRKRNKSNETSYQQLNKSTAAQRRPLDQSSMTSLAGRKSRLPRSLMSSRITNNKVAMSMNAENDGDAQEFNPPVTPPRTVQQTAPDRGKGLTVQKRVRGQENGKKRAAIHTSTTPQGGASNRTGRKPPPTIPNNYKLENFGITGHGLK